MTLIAERLLTTLTDAERARMEKVESVLPALREAAAKADETGEFPVGHIALMREAGLLGLIIPEEFGGLGGGLRDLAGATFTLGSACPSTALAYFFHNTSASRGLLPLEAIEAGLFAEDEVPVIKAFAERLLTNMAGGTWLANFASEEVKSSSANIAIATIATPVEGGWSLSGVKSFGCATGVADYYLVTAKVDGTTDADGLALFLVNRDSEGITNRPKWNGLGMRASANDGVIMENVFVPSEDSLTVPGSFVKMLQMSRGSFVGNQLAIMAVYLGAAQNAYDYALERTTGKTFADTGKTIASSPMHQVIIGNMAERLETAYLWIRRQIELETSEPPLLPKAEVYKQWRIAKGDISEACFQVALGALKACGTSAATMDGVIGRTLRDLAMALVMTFPAERGRLEAASMITQDKENELFASVNS
ncbi:acyl-CoA dehydrogenase family protein [Actinocorallia aurantiaca]|uniref:Dibenzothiophene monooxygenase n=1 Tax=Actinocorallia aurantiaca TaxID=46204 RepID=A0ABN3UDC6_9ACTN